MTVMHDDPLCPHGVPSRTACNDCLAEISDPWANPWGEFLNPPQGDTPVPNPRGDE